MAGRRCYAIMIRLRYSIKFVLHRRERADGTFTVRMNISWAKKRVQRNIPAYVFPDQWDENTMTARATRQHKDVSGINSVIAEYKGRVTKYFETSIINDHVPTEDEINGLFNTEDAEEENQKHLIDDTIEEFIAKESVERGWASVTKNKFKNLKHDLLCADLTYIEELNEEGLEKYTQYLFSRDLENAVLMKKASILRWFLGWCRKKGYIENDDYKLHQPHLKCPQKTVVYLTWEELMQLYKHNYGYKYQLSIVRDVFCFCAFTGLRYSDAARLRWSDVYNDHITIITQKTSDKLDIDLNPFSKSIIKKYSLKADRKPADKVLGAPTIQRSNVMLKECALLAGIKTPITLVSYRGSKRVEESVPKWKAVTTHCARRTFVVNSLRLGIPAEVIMKWTGHSDFTAMKPYVAIVDELKKENMAKYATLYENEKKSSN